MADRAIQFGPHPTMIYLWRRALREGAFGTFALDGRNAPEINDEQVRDLHVKIRELDCR